MTCLFCLPQRPQQSLLRSPSPHGSHRLAPGLLGAVAALLTLSACTGLTPPTASEAALAQAASALQAARESDASRSAQVDQRLAPLLRRQPYPRLLLLGEQHDAPQHQQLQLEIVRSLLRQGRLGALTLEMAESGRSTTGLDKTAGETAVQQALAWNDAGWPWVRYAPAIMAAVREGIPVMGANLPRNQQRDAMKNEALDARLTSASLQKQLKNIDDGHCGMLAPAQLAPMARIQIARDLAMAGTLTQTLQRLPPPDTEQRAGPPQLVVLIAGNAHVERELGVPRHLPPAIPSRSIASLAGATASDTLDVDLVWPTDALPPRDYCADFKASLQPQPKP